MSAANLLTSSRLILAPVGVAILLLPGIPYHVTISTVIFVVAALTDTIDGTLARRAGQATLLGSMLDGIADKLLVLLYFVVLQNQGVYPLWILLLLLGREIVVTGLRTYLLPHSANLIDLRLPKLKALLQFSSITVGLLSLMATEWPALPAEALAQGAYRLMIFALVLSVILPPKSIRHEVRRLLQTTRG